jgi:hypothetical protein
MRTCSLCRVSRWLKLSQAASGLVPCGGSSHRRRSPHYPRGTLSWIHAAIGSTPRKVLPVSLPALREEFQRNGSVFLSVFAKIENPFHRPAEDLEILRQLLLQRDRLPLITLMGACRASRDSGCILCSRIHFEVR